jgi:hypothetical protein
MGKRNGVLHFLVVFLGLGFLLCAMWLASYLAKLG